MALVLALYLLLCVRVTADVCAGAAKGQIVFSADVGALMFHAQVNGHIHGRKLSMRFPLPALKKKPSAKGLRKGWTMARAVLQSADWELIALHMCAGLEDAGATAMLAAAFARWRTACWQAQDERAAAISILWQILRRRTRRPRRGA